MKMSKIRFLLAIPDPGPRDSGSLVRLAIRDTTLADALHPTVAETTEGLDDAAEGIEVSLELPDQALDPRHRYSVWAHVDHEGQGEIQTGDLITTQEVSVRPEHLDADPVEVPLTRI